MNILHQNKKFISKELHFDDSKLYYKENKYGNITEYEITFEKIEGSKVNYRTTNLLLLASGLGSLLIGIFSTITYLVKNLNPEVLTFGAVFGFFGVGLLIYYWLTIENYWKLLLSNNGYIFIHKNSPDAETVEAFYKTLIETRNSYLKETYGHIDKHLNYSDQLHNLQWLRRINVISNQEYDEKYNQLQNIINPIKKDIGFGA